MKANEPKNKTDCTLANKLVRQKRKSKLRERPNYSESLINVRKENTLWVTMNEITLPSKRVLKYKIFNYFR